MDTAVDLAIGENGSEIAYSSHSARTAQAQCTVRPLCHTGGRPLPLVPQTGKSCPCMTGEHLNRMLRPGSWTPAAVTYFSFFMANNHSKTITIGLQYQSECCCEQEEPSQT